MNWLKIGLRYIGICMLAWFVVISIMTVLSSAEATQSDDLSREEQIQLMSDCYRDVRIVVKQSRTFSDRMTSDQQRTMLRCFWEYRTRNR